MEWFAIALTGLPFLTTVASRGFPGSEKPLPFAVLRVHPIAPVLAALGSGATLCLLPA